MVRTEYICDHCGEPFDPIKMGHCNVDLKFGTRQRVYDLCHVCFNHINKLFQDFDDECDDMKRLNAPFE